MKKFFCWVLFCSLIVGCKPGLEPDPIPPPPPPPIPAPIVTLDVPTNAGYLQDVTISWSSVNAKTVTKSFTNGTDVTGSFVVKAIAKTTIFSVVAQGDGGQCTVEKTVSVKIPTGADSLAAHGWKLKSIEQWKKSTNTIVSRSDLSLEQLSDAYFYTTDGYWHVYHAGQITEYGGGKYTFVGKKLTIGDFVYRLTLLSDLKLEFELDDPWVVDQVIKYFYEKV